MKTMIDADTVDDILADWDDEPQEIANQMQDKYGLPDEATPSRLIWYDTGMWKRSVLHRDGVPHHFPKEHTDYLKQVIDYQAPTDEYDNLATFDGSVLLDRTKGEMAARCDKEAMNFLAINLAHDIITGDKTVDEARQHYAKTAVKAMMGAEPDYTTDFQFGLPEGDQHDPDETIVTDAMKQEVRDMLGGAEGEPSPA